MAGMWACECKALNNSRDKVCSVCGRDRTSTKAMAAPGKLTICPADKALVRDGFCSLTGWFPMTATCPFACPICRKPLEWCGACYSCHGTSSGKREDWEFPGDRYELEDGHWIKIVDGPRRACTPTENQAGARELLRVLAGAPMLTKRRAEPADVIPF